jgi:integrase/recombinase XerD
MKEISHTKHTANWGLVTGAVYFDDRRPKKNGLFPVKIRITHKRERLYVNTGYSHSLKDWGLFDTNIKEIRKARIAILKQYEIIGNAIEDMNSRGVFSFALLNRHLGRGKKDDVFSHFEARISDLRSKGFVGNAMIHECALNCLKSHVPLNSLSFDKINIAWLEGYETAMAKDGKSTTTRSMYLRCLRAIINRAGKPSPFGRDKFQIKTGGGRKMALTKQQINEVLMKYEVIARSTTDKMRDLFYFSYLTNGINIKDLVLLKWSDIKNDSIHFIRAKTARINAKEVDIVAPILPQMKLIIDKWGDKESKYIFGYIHDRMTPQEIRVSCQNVTRLINKHMKLITDATGLPHISTYTARHSNATNLLRGGAQIEFISGQLGHSKISTTQAYLAGFDDETRRRMNEILTAQ